MKSLVILLVCFLLQSFKITPFFGYKKHVTYECEYLLEGSSEVQPNEVLSDLPYHLNVKFKIITDGYNYLIIGQLQQVDIAHIDVYPLIVDNMDSILIERNTKLAYIFSSRTYSEIETAEIDPIIRKDSLPNKVIVQYQKKQETKFYIDSAYNSIITPFPQFIGNKYGIVKIIMNKNVCILKTVKITDFDFEFVKKATRKFNYSSDKVPLPIF